MIDLHPQYVTDAAGTRVAVQLSVEEYEQLLDEAEMVEDIVAYQAAKAEDGEAVPYEHIRSELGLAP